MKILVRSVLSGAVLLACGLSVFGRPQNRRREIRGLSQVAPLLSSRDSTSVQDPYILKPAIFTTPLDANINFGGDTNSNTLPGAQYLSLLGSPLDQNNNDYTSAQPSNPIEPITPEAQSGFPTQLESGFGQKVGSVFSSNPAPLYAQGVVTANDFVTSGNGDTPSIIAQSPDTSPLLTTQLLQNLVVNMGRIKTLKYCFYQLSPYHDELFLSAIGRETSTWSEFFRNFHNFGPGFGFYLLGDDEVLIVMNLFRKCWDDAIISSSDGSCGAKTVLQQVAKDPKWIASIQPVLNRIHNEGPVDDEAGLRAIENKYKQANAPAANSS
ncbi:hypothetical protein MMC07_000221 [Pseudocyphellaria aurata]|nr:hypothetical protein [Pseudocyphellaria aurata]